MDLTRAIAKRKRSVVKRMVRYAAKQNVLEKICIGIANSAGSIVAPITSYEGHVVRKPFVVAPASFSEVQSPVVFGGKAVVSNRTLPAIQPLELYKVTVWPDSSVFLSDGKALVPQHAYEDRFRLNWMNSCCAYDVQGYLALHRRPEKHIVRGICGFGHYSINWYHWLIETLPGIMLAQNLPAEYDDFPLLVPEEILEITNFRNTLEMFSNGRDIIPLSSDFQFRVDQLLFVPPPVSGPGNLQNGFWPTVSDYEQNVGVIKRFREAILDNVDLNEPYEGPKRVFLARPPANRSFNQDELVEISKAFGFEVVYPEKMSFREQVRLFQSAEIIVGPSGAAWSGALFLRPGAKALVWVLREYSQGCFFSNLAALSGADMRYFFVDAEGGVSGTYQAFFAKYEVSSDAFTDALYKICEVPPATSSKI